ncbi:MAG: GumC family protein, partial [bacterium]
MEKEEIKEIDLLILGKIMLKNKKKYLAIIILCTLAALILAFVVPKKYESTALLSIKANSNAQKSLLASNALLSGMVGDMGGAGMANTYIEMMQSRQVIAPLIQKLDLPAEKKLKMTNKDFAEKYLQLSNVKMTDLIAVNVTGKSPAEAKMLADELIKNFITLLTDLNHNKQSLMLKFLNERLSVAKTDLDKATENFEAYRQKHGIFVPDKQTAELLDRNIQAINRSAQLQVEINAGKMRLKELNRQLGEQNAALQQYQTGDNESIRKIRSSLIDKEIALLDTRQKYTDNHPSVVRLKKEIAELRNKIAEEVNASVAVGINNPVQVSLLESKLTAETNLIVNQDILSAVEKLQAQYEDGVKNLSTDSIEYFKLQWEAEMAKQIYYNLVTKKEEAKLNQAMECMDIQIVDPP